MTTETLGCRAYPATLALLRVAPVSHVDPRLHCLLGVDVLEIHHRLAAGRRPKLFDSIEHRLLAHMHVVHGFVYIYSFWKLNIQLT